MALSNLINKINCAATAIRCGFGSAIILAGGSGTRAGGDNTKQMTQLCGIPVVCRTIITFEECETINEIIIVAKKEELENYSSFISKYQFKKITAIVEGGKTRFDSTIAGFKKISDKSDLVYIHDAARCLVTKEMILNVAKEASKFGAAFAAQKATDTVKILNEGKISTVNRDTVWLAQTPQVFKTDLYRASAYNALQKDIQPTDDCMLAEACGFSPVPVDCGKENMKITLPCDFAIAEAILGYRASKHN